MNGQQIFEKALCIMGLLGDDVASDVQLRRKMKPIINSVYADLYWFCKKRGKLCIDDAAEYSSVEDMCAEIALPPEIVNDCFIYGVAMWIAQTLCDNDNQRFFARLFEYKRDLYTKNAYTSVVTDVLP